MPKFRVFVKTVEYGVFEYEGKQTDLEENLDSIVENADDEGLIRWTERDVV